MDEGMPVAYQVLAEGVCVYAADGTQVGTVHHVIAAVDQDIFHGLVIATVGHGRRFVEAADVASLHERGVDLRIDVEAVAALAEPGGAAPEYSEDPSQTKWAHWARRLSGRSDWQRRR